MSGPNVSDEVVNTVYVVPDWRPAVVGETVEVDLGEKVGAVGVVVGVDDKGDLLVDFGCLVDTYPAYAIRPI